MIIPGSSSFSEMAFPELTGETNGLYKPPEIQEVKPGFWNIFSAALEQIGDRLGANLNEHLASGGTGAISSSGVVPSTPNNQLQGAFQDTIVKPIVNGMIEDIPGLGDLSGVLPGLSGSNSGMDPGVISPSVEGTSANSSGFDLSSLMGSSAYQASAGLQSYYEMWQKTGDDAYLEKLIDNFMALENTSSARSYETEMSNTAFSRLIDDIKASGYNPWLALQSGMNQASGGTGTASSVSSISSSSQKTSRENNENTASASRYSALLHFIGTLFSAMIGAGSQLGKAAMIAGA